MQSAKFKVEKRLIVVNDSYANLRDIVEREKFQPVNGVLLDLGLSSWELENSGRGFSFQKNEELDMRYSVQSLTAREIINEWSEEELARIFSEYGQERFAKNIARKIVDIRLQQPIETTFELVEIIRKSFPRSYKFGKQPRRKTGSLRGRHFATRTFQALRIATNSELENLRVVLPQALDTLASNGRLVVISFHSLEDSIVKRFFKEQSKNGRAKILTLKPVMASLAEIKNNPRARSAKLRVALKLN